MRNEKKKKKKGKKEREKEVNFSSNSDHTRGNPAIYLSSIRISTKNAWEKVTPRALTYRDIIT
jgi:hypothetical protein